MSDKQPTQPAQPVQHQAQHQGPHVPAAHPHPRHDPNLEITLDHDAPQDACEMDPATFNGRDPRAHKAWHDRFRARVQQLATKNPTG